MIENGRFSDFLKSEIRSESTLKGKFRFAQVQFSGMTVRDLLCYFFIWNIQKHPSKGVLKKRCSEDMQQIYRTLTLKLLCKCHCAKSDRIRPAFGLNTERSPYSVQMREYANQNNSEYRRFSRSVFLKNMWQLSW